MHIRTRNVWFATQTMIVGLFVANCGGDSTTDPSGTGASAASGGTSDGGGASGGQGSGGEGTGAASSGGAASGGSASGGGSSLGGLGGFGGELIVGGDPPSIFIISDLGTTPGTAFPSFLVHFYDDHTAPEDLIISVESSDETFLPITGIVFGDITNEGQPDVGHSYRSLTLTPTTLTSGGATVTVTVKDGAGQSGTRSFAISINDTLLNDAEAISVTSGAEPVLGSYLSYSAGPSLSEDGLLVAFESNASNFGSGPSAVQDIYLRNRTAQTTTRLTNGLGTNERPTMTPDGRYIAFYSSYPIVAGDTNGVFDCYLLDRQTSTFFLISVGDDESPADAASRPGTFESSRPALSDDGRYVAFVSSATNLVTGDTNSKVDVFVRDRTLETTTRVSVSSSGVEGDADSGQPAMSGDGALVAFSSLAKTLQDGVTDTDTRSDVFLRTAGTTVRMSRANGTQNAANGMSDSPALSGDGKFLAFSSAATNLDPTTDFNGHTDIWLYSLVGSTFLRINTDLDPSGSQGYSSGPALSNDGQRVVFTTQGYIGSYLSNSGQTYTYDVATDKVDIASLNNVAGVPNGGSSYEPVISRDGTTVAFQTAASDIVYGDTNSGADVFVVPF